MTLRRKLTGLAVLVGMIAALLAATTSVAGAGLEVSETDLDLDSTVFSFGTLDLVLDGVDNRLEFDFDDPTEPNDVQTLTANAATCALESTGDTLIDFSSTDKGTSDPTDNYPGLSGSTAGVHGQGEGLGTPCGLINRVVRGKKKLVNNQKLILTLAGSDLQDKFFYGVNLNIKMKFETTVRVAFYRDAVLVWTEVVSCGDVSDCGPDSSNDIFLVPIPATLNGIDGNPGTIDDLAVLGNRIEISILSSGEGGLSDEGAAGLEESATADSFFGIAEQFDGTLDCTPGPSSEAFTELGATSEAQIARLENITGECIDKNYNLDSSANQVNFVPDADNQAAAFVAKLTFPAREATNPFNAELRYDRDGVDLTFGFTFMPWCEITAALSPNLVTQLQAVDFNTDLLNGQPDLPNASDTWCIISQQSVSIGDTPSDGLGVLLQNMWWVYGEDDPFFGGN